MDTSKLAFPKGPTRKQLKAKRRRREAAVVADVRAKVVGEDGYCRFSGAQPLLGCCSGESEWAHFGEKKRFKTRGMEPEKRHTVEGSLMLCERHHDMYDDGVMAIEVLEPAKGTRGRLRATTAHATYEEAA